MAAGADIDITNAVEPLPISDSLQRSSLAIPNAIEKHCGGMSTTSSGDGRRYRQGRRVAVSAGETSGRRREDMQPRTSGSLAFAGRKMNA
ncbi:hypothetical protein GUJ93_ZPchr0008g13566 [Zizania palustris]|uniref:Uncharacterized protein n=1 Tax=Zizania palustris TaxID=103762 RepID=A0A8J5RGF1_ZIZPA|nr:hypothetical protein GUJ93_ZPchr0008g13566 [Zizania palustris]